MKNTEIKKQLYIIPGYDGLSTNHWYPWLERTMRKEGFITKTMNFPDPSQPKVKIRLDYLAKHMTEINENTFFVTRSMGGVTTLRYLQEINKPSKVGGYILVAGFFGLNPDIQSIPTFANLSAEGLQDLLDFSDFKPDYDYLSNITKNRVVIAAEDDTLLPFKLNMSEALAKNLNAEFEVFKKGGHFLAADGFLKFSLIYDLLMNMIKAEK